MAAPWEMAALLLPSQSVAVALGYHPTAGYSVFCRLRKSLQNPAPPQCPRASLEAEQSASRQLGRKGEWKGGSFEQGGARPAGRAFDQSVGRWSGRYTSADGSSGRAEHWKSLALTQQRTRTSDANEGLNDVTTSVSSRNSRSFVFAYVTIMRTRNSPNPFVAGVRPECGWSAA
jgi:hypothetical protein